MTEPLPRSCRRDRGFLASGTALVVIHDVPPLWGLATTATIIIAVAIDDWVR